MSTKITPTWSSSTSSCPEKDGLETLLEILTIDAAARVITFSGREGAGEHNETAEILGAVASFRKPFVLRSVRTTIRDALRRSPH